MKNPKNADYNCNLLTDLFKTFRPACSKFSFSYYKLSNEIIFLKTNQEILILFYHIL